MFNEVIAAIFLLSVTIQVAYALYFFVQVFRIPIAAEPSSAQKPVSVIICAKNEAANLLQNLPAVMAQRYINDAGIVLFKVIVVNDASEDDTAKVLAGFREIYPQLQVVTIATNEVRDVPGKKYALGKGIAAAETNLIVVTDADCKPSSDQWLAKMVAPLLNGKGIVAGYGKYIQQPGLLNRFIRWETLHTFLQYSGYALAGKPYMATGRNLAYHKDAFVKASATPAWGALPSGDDDLLIEAYANAGNMSIVCDEHAFTISPAKNTWAEWVKQKQRHLSTGKYYKKSIQLLLACYASTHALIWLLFLMSLFTSFYQTALVVMLCRCFIYWLIWAYTAKRLGEKDLVIWFPVMDFAWLLYNFAFSPYIFLKNKTQWK
ncbi:MAG: hypothetical protein BGO70_09885 [Bacteroidetes bacterium 43-93]|nr:glycosyltransferase [Bacteroidota bacterium]OJX00467.1 MAG: hypothetical protein BGO70_09885 [Bacteroidetes bacterium 43-93]